MRRAGYTLIELASVLVVAALLAATAAPALSRMQRDRSAALTREAERLLTVARDRALDAGVPAGVRFDPVAQEAHLLELPGASAPPRSFTGVVRLRERFPGASYITIKAEGAERDALWFGPDGTPHLRDDGGVFLADLTSTASLGTSGGVIAVYPTSGLIERN